MRLEGCVPHAGDVGAHTWPQQDLGRKLLDNMNLQLGWVVSKLFKMTGQPLLAHSSLEPTIASYQGLGMPWLGV